ncbi:MAG: hypothetical protein KF750_14300 [Xanthobacteraceae bacterium]|nr:hypothetical protein [Xanthobacteraceae bacterium]
MEFISLWWKIIAGVILPLGGFAAFLFLPGFALAIGNLLSTKGGRTIAFVALAAWLLWMAFAIVEKRSYTRGAQETIGKIDHQNQQAIDAARKARIPVAECYARDGEWSVEDGTCVLPQ